MSRIIPISDLGRAGIIADIPFSELPLNAWTDAKNMRFRDGAAERFTGHVAQLGVPNTPPEWLLTCSQGGTAFWLYASATKVGATDGSSHADLTRAVGGNYTTSPVCGWTGTIIEDIPVINNGVDVPQMWNKPALSQKLQDLTGWPASHLCNCLTGFKRYLVALDVSKQGVRYPMMIKWSHQAATGQVPSLWAVDNDALDAGEYTLPGDGGFLVDGKALRDVMILYKEYQTWQMQYVAGGEIFRFNRLFDNIGAITRRCALEFFSGKHLVFTGEDVILHDGQQAKSLISKRLRAKLSAIIDTTHFNKSFVCADYLSNEVWICIPESGSAYCTIAFVWNWLDDSWGVRELPKVRYATSGMVNPQSIGETWDGSVGVWDTDNVAWGDRISDPTKRKLLMAVAEDGGKLLTPDIGHTFESDKINAFVERRGMGFPLGKSQSGQAVPDYTRAKQVLSLWPRISGTSGGTLSVALGTQPRVDSPVQWGTPRSFVIGQTHRLDFSGSPASHIHAIRFESNDETFWRLHGYDVEVVDRGMR